MRVFTKTAAVMLAVLLAVSPSLAFIEKIDAEEVVERIEVSEAEEKSEKSIPTPTPVPAANSATVRENEAAIPEQEAAAEAAETEAKTESPTVETKQMLLVREKTYLPINLTAASQDAKRQKEEGWSWDAEKSTLTLDGVNIETLGTTVILPDGEVTVVVKGDNSIVSRGSSKDSICCFEGASKRKAALTIKGDGWLSLNPSNGKGNSAGFAVDKLTVSMDGDLDINCKSYGARSVTGIYALDSIHLAKGETAINYTGKAGGTFCGASAYTGGYVQDKKAGITIKASGTRDSISGIAARETRINGRASITAKSGGYLTAVYADENVELGESSDCVFKLTSAKDRALAVLALDGWAELNGLLKADVTAEKEAGGVYAEAVRLASSTSLITSKLTATSTDIAEGSFGIKSKTDIGAKYSKLNVKSYGPGSHALAAAKGYVQTNGEAVLWGDDAAIFGTKDDTALKVTKGTLTAESESKAAVIKGNLLLDGAVITEGGKRGSLDAEAAKLVIEPGEAKPVKTPRAKSSESKKAKDKPQPTPAPKSDSTIRFGR